MCRLGTVSCEMIEKKKEKRKMRFRAIRDVSRYVKIVLRIWGSMKLKICGFTGQTISYLPNLDVKEIKKFWRDLQMKSSKCRGR